MQELLVMAQIAGRRCAFPAHDVKSVIEIGAITPVPCTPDFILGITAMRSQALTVVDCRSALGLDDASWSLDDRAVVVLVGGHFYALRVDSIEDITSALGEPEDVPGGFGKEWTRVASGMVETRAGPALLVDLPLLIAGPDALGVAA